jgi:hypothetical protein
MITRSWIRNLFARTPRTGRKAPARCRPRLEALEDRLAPAVTDITPGHTGTFATIQQAVNFANPGDTILADAGTYAEQVTINKSVTLLGANNSNPVPGRSGPESIVEPGLTSSFDTDSVFQVTANNVTIEGFTIQGSLASPPAGQSTGFTLTSGTTVYAAAGISNSGNVNTGGSAPSTTDISGLTIRNNIIKDFTQVGVYGDTSDGTVSTGNTIADNLISDVPNNGQGGYSGAGVLISDNFYADVTGNKLSNVHTGIQTGNNYLPSGTFVPSISNNIVSATVKGIYDNLEYESASPFTVSDNTITQDNGSVSPAYNVGLLIQSMQSSVQSVIQGNNVSGFLYGVELAGNNTTNPVTVEGGTLSNNTNGVWATNNDYFYPASYNTTAALDGVTITNSTKAGVWVDSTSANSQGQFNTTNTVTLAVTDGTTITGGPVGLLVDGANSLASLTQSTITGNGIGVHAGAGGGGIENNGTVTLTNCTLADNSAILGGGIFNAGTLAVLFCTISGNSVSGTGGQGGGIYQDPSSGSTTLQDTIDAGNRALAGAAAPDYAGAVSSSLTVGTTSYREGSNLIGDGTGSSGFTGPGDQVGGTPSHLAPIDPLLGPLHANGGLTQTMALLPGSPAIGQGGPLATAALPVAAGTATVTLSPATALAVGQQLLIDPGQPHQELVTVTAVTATGFTATFAQAHAAHFAVALATDQRGVLRLAAAPDIGAFQDRGFTLQVSGGSGQEAFTGNGFHSPLVATVASPAGDPVAGGVITFTSPGSGTSTTTLSTPVTIAADGTATATVTANSTAGHYQVTAAAAGVSGGAAFALTNVAVAFGTQALTYNGCPQAISATVTPADATYAVGYLQGTTASAEPTNAGSNYAIVITLPDGEQQRQPFAIGQAPLTITANPATKIQGEADPPFSVSYSGFVNKETARVLGGVLTFTLTPTTGGYLITPGGLTSGNYAISFVSGLLTVLSYSDATRALRTQVDTAGLDHGMQSSLDDQLQAAIASFAAGDTADGVSQLGAFIHHVRAQSGKKIDATHADAFFAYAQRIINAVG